MLGSVQRGTTRPRIQPDWLNLLGAWKYYIGSHKRTAGICTSINRSIKAENLLIIKLLFIIHSKEKNGRETNPTYNILYIIYSHKGLLIHKINQTVLNVSIITYKGITKKNSVTLSAVSKLTHLIYVHTHGNEIIYRNIFKRLVSSVSGRQDTYLNFKIEDYD